MKRLARLAIAAALLSSPLFAGQPSADEKKVWSMEDTYWRYVQANDLEHYRTLWHKDFLGWPLSNPEPARKAQITDWITLHTSKGESLKSYDLERLAAQVTDNLATVAYRVRLHWVNQKGAPVPGSLRVIHTWQRNAGGEWQIISGMAAPTNADGH
ncbi:MAG TPA: nuclear transport factor 2 family protein [Steroidobacteraceae bacterium]|nr:nuclear transport factor 2 family protein [Steroidobacteraceae bacterium]